MSKIWNVNVQDWLRGLVISVLTAILTIFAQEITTGMIDFKQLGIAALSAGCAYVLKKLGTDENGKLLGKL